jgi:hypothetical protein
MGKKTALMATYLTSGWTASSMLLFYRGRFNWGLIGALTLATFAMVWGVEAATYFSSNTHKIAVVKSDLNSVLASATFVVSEDSFFRMSEVATINKETFLNVGILIDCYNYNINDAMTIAFDCWAKGTPVPGVTDGTWKILFKGYYEFLTSIPDGLNRLADSSMVDCTKEFVHDATLKELPNLVVRPLPGSSDVLNTVICPGAPDIGYQDPTGTIQK